VQTELLGTQRELRTVQAERALLLDSTMRRGEDERVRIAAELHDGPVQRLAALGYLLERAVRVGGRGNSEGAAALAAEAMTQLRAEVEGLRRLMSNLRPPALDESGLEDALRDHLSTVFAGTGVAVGLVSELGEDHLSATTKTALYRVAQEALLNVRQHAAAHHVQVRLERRDGATMLSISDDGVGFSPDQATARLREGHFGLVGMRERVELAGGKWHLETAPGSGTRITASVPDEPGMRGSAKVERASWQPVPA
jgi:signal transduction histidine kinase